MHDTQTPSEGTVINVVLEQVNQGHSTRAELYRLVEKGLGANRRLVSFFTSFAFPVGIADEDADMLEDVLRATLRSEDELVLMINSPGGDLLAAERIVNICRSHSAKGQYAVIIPKMAKSAATVISMGAREILMSPTSELGPIDPQILMTLAGDGLRLVPAHEVIESYDDLMEKAEQTEGQLAPFLQQLERYDATKIRNIKSVQALSASVAVRTLKSGMMSNDDEPAILEKIKQFLDPTRTGVHGRPIYPEAAGECGLKISMQDLRSDLWRNVWNLYVRLNHVTSKMFGKIVESEESSYFAARPKRAET